MADLSGLQQTLGITFKDLSLLEQALTHSSYVNENAGIVQDSNERLEFLGDAVLGLVVAEKLYQDFPQFSEGEMTKHRAALVRRDTLSAIARSIDLGDYLFLGRGEETSGGRRKPANLAGALEALIAAIFLDQGLDTAKDCILSLVSPEMQKIISHNAVTDYKSQLQELIQARFQQTPTYQVVETAEPEHGREFIIEVKLGEKVLGSGSGRSKKAAETEAARSALEQFST